MSMSPYEGPMQPYGDFEPDEDFEPMQMRGGSSWQPGWRPPHAPPPGCGPWSGPGPGGGGWPFWGYWGFRLRNAWRDIKFLQKVVHDIVNDMVDDGLIAPGPNAPTTGPGSGTGTTTGVKGVTDGSDAAPGMVGEFMKGQVDIAFGGYPQITQTTVSPLVLSPGDWDIRAAMSFTVPINVGSFQLSPIPTGVSNSMIGAIGVSDPTAWAMQNALSLIGKTARGSVSVPTLLPFSIYISQLGLTTMTAGTATLFVEARRMR